MAVLAGLGIALRLYHFLREPSLWHDEAALVLNVLNKDFRKLLGPLSFSEAAPPVFLWLERAVVLTLGDGVDALRLVPLAASCAAMLLILPVASRLLPPASAGWAVLLFACSDRLLWHACEAKQYAVEAFLALALVALYVRTSCWPLPRRIVLFALLAPVVVWSAYPGCFLCGGLLIALLNEVRRAGGPTAWLAYSALAAAVLVSFAILVVGPVHAQRDQTIVECWQGMRQFPDWHHPAGVPLWMLRSTLDLVGYVCKPVGQILAPLAIVGIVAMWRRGARDALLLLLIPIGLALAASCFEAYPYGGMRVMVYAAPAVVLLVAAGVGPTLDWLRSRQPAAAIALVAILLMPLGRAVHTMAVPWSRADCAAAADYVVRNRLASDCVVSNHWEYLYYFRGLGAKHIAFQNFAPPEEGRFWVVITGATPADREPGLARFQCDGWQTRQRSEFERTTVLLVEREG
jgi:hypothetical protein